MELGNDEQSINVPDSAPCHELANPADIELNKKNEIDELFKEINNSLYIRGDDSDRLVVPEFEYTPLDPDSDEARLLTLHPTSNAADHVCCDLETHPLTDLPPFVAIQNARGYCHMIRPIEVSGKALLISVALEMFLRYFRTKIKEPARIWVRYTCVVKSNKQEQAKYWTREFSDSMYSRATEVFDMHETNSRLVDEGYFERVAASPEYTSWTKEWYGRPDKIVLPKVCPIRLGTKPSYEEPTMKYQYMPLDSIADEIRIMNIMPSEDTSARIVILAAHSPIKCEATFTALSYRWGTDLTPEEIVLNGQKKLIRKTLAEAIRALRMTESILPIWIDALSINQDDVVERGRQVPRMGTIYDNATAVYTYVGEQTDDTAQALDLMRELGQHPMVRTNNRGEFHFGPWDYDDGNVRYGENRIKPDQLAPLCASLYKFLTRQYFRRTWVLQEVAFASNPTIIAGRRLNIGFEQLEKAAYNFQNMLMRDLSLAGQMQIADPSLEEVNVDMLAYPRKLFYFRHLVSRGADGFPFVNMKATSPTFLEALVLTRDFECTDPRDHIFGLWSLVQDKKGLDLKADYSKPYEEMYAEFAQAWIGQHRTLDVLGAVEATQQSCSFYEKVPSWCPNWNIPAMTSCLVRKDYIPPVPMTILDQDGELYSADGRMNRDSFDVPMFSFEGNILNCTGIIIDQIKLMFDDPPELLGGTMFPRCDWESNWKFRCWTDGIESHYQRHDLATYDDPLRAAWAMLHGDNAAAWPPPAESGYRPDLYRPNEQYVCLPSLSRHVRVYADSYSRTFARGVVKTVLRGRRPFISENGHMGLAPFYIAEMDNKDDKPWLLAVVAGCSVPLLLRERDDGTYQLLGTCFVQGWMDGEWMETMMGADSPTEFWNAVRGDSEILIS